MATRKRPIFFAASLRRTNCPWKAQAQKNWEQEKYGERRKERTKKHAATGAQKSNKWHSIKTNNKHEKTIFSVRTIEFMVLI